MAGMLVMYDLGGRDAWLYRISQTRTPTILDAAIGYFVVVLMGYFITAIFRKKIDRRAR